MKKTKGPKVAVVKATKGVTSRKKETGRRTRQTGVRGKVLELLASGPKTSAELVRAGGFSSAALYLNIKALKADGQVSAKRNGREIMLSLNGKRSATSQKVQTEVIVEPVVVGTTRPAMKSSDMVIAYVPAELHEALNGLSRRLQPVDALAEKLNVLDHLCRTIPVPIAAVLKSIAEDLQRVAEGHRNPPLNS